MSEDLGTISTGVAINLSDFAQGVPKVVEGVKTINAALDGIRTITIKTNASVVVGELQTITAELRTAATTAEALNAALGKISLNPSKIVSGATTVTKSLMQMESDTLRVQGALNTLNLNPSKIAQGSQSAIKSVSSIAAAAKSAQSQLNGLKVPSSASAVGTGHRGVSGEGFSEGGSVLLGASVALAAPLAAAVDASTLFNKSIQESGFNSNLSAKEIETLTANVKALAQISPSPIDDISKAFMRLSNFGYQGADAMKIARAANEAATATGAPLEETTEALARTMFQFNVPVEDASRVMNLLHFAAGATNQNLADFVAVAGRGMEAASELHVGLADSAAIMGVLTKAGETAAQSTTSFRAVIKGITEPTNSARKELEHLKQTTGVDLPSAFTAAGLASHGLTGVLEMVNKATGGNADAIKKVFTDSRNFIPVVALMTMRHGELIKVLDGSKQAWRDNNLVQSQYAEVMGRLDSQLGTLRNQLEVTAASFGTDLRPQIEGVVNQIDGFLSELNQLSPAQKQAAVDALATGAALTAVSGSLLLVVGKGQAAIEGITALGAAFTGAGTAATLSFGVGGVVIVALTALIYEIGLTAGAWADAQAAADRYSAAVAHVAGENPLGAVVAEKVKIAGAMDTEQTNIDAAKQVVAHPFMFEGQVDNLEWAGGKRPDDFDSANPQDFVNRHTHLLDEYKAAYAAQTKSADQLSSAGMKSDEYTGGKPKSYPSYLTGAGGKPTHAPPEVGSGGKTARQPAPLADTDPISFSLDKRLDNSDDLTSVKLEDQPSNSRNYDAKMSHIDNSTAGAVSDLRSGLLANGEGLDTAGAKAAEYALKLKELALRIALTTNAVNNETAALPAQQNAVAAAKGAWEEAAKKYDAYAASVTKHPGTTAEDKSAQSNRLGALRQSAEDARSVYTDAAEQFASSGAFIDSGTAKLKDFQEQATETHVETENLWKAASQGADKFGESVDRAMRKLTEKSDTDGKLDDWREQVASMRGDLAQTAQQQSWSPATLAAANAKLDVLDTSTQAKIRSDGAKSDFKDSVNAEDMNFGSGGEKNDDHLSALRSELTQAKALFGDTSSEAKDAADAIQSFQEKIAAGDVDQLTQTFRRGQMSGAEYEKQLRAVQSTLSESGAEYKAIGDVIDEDVTRRIDAAREANKKFGQEFGTIASDLIENVNSIDDEVRKLEKTLEESLLQKGMSKLGDMVANLVFPTKRSAPASSSPITAIASDASALPFGAQGLSGPSAYSAPKGPSLDVPLLSLSDAGDAVKEGGKSASVALTGSAGSMANAAAGWENALATLKGGKTTAGAGSGLGSALSLASLIPGPIGIGAGIIGGIGHILGFADGGDPPPGKISMVGESGPELIGPKSSMRVLSNDFVKGLSSTNGMQMNVGAPLTPFWTKQNMGGYGAWKAAQSPQITVTHNGDINNHEQGESFHRDLAWSIGQQLPVTTG